MRRAATLLTGAFAIFCAHAALAAAPASSPLPAPRAAPPEAPPLAAPPPPEPRAAAGPVGSALAPAAVPAPEPAPRSAAPAPVEVAARDAAPPSAPRPTRDEETAGTSPLAPAKTPSPEPRGEPPAIALLAPPRAASPPEAQSAPAGSVCGDARLRGARIATIVGPAPGCGVAEPVTLASAAGVTLAGDVRLGCPAARALADWLEKSVRPTTRKHTGSDLAAVKTDASYVCRSRNGRKGAKLSEHARGAAIDISEFRLADGRVIDVRRGWRSGQNQSYLRALWRAACGPFGTVLGPAADQYHKDHFHLDVAQHRNGDYCR